MTFVCEHCNKNMTSVENAHSMLIVLQKVDSLRGYSFYQCELGSYVHGHTFQHWQCSKDEMIDGVKYCIGHHYHEQLLQKVPPYQVRLHIQVLNSELSCIHCQAPLKDSAYRFCLTRATPYNSIVGSHDSLEGWSCSMDHAMQQAFQLLDSERDL